MEKLLTSSQSSALFCQNSSAFASHVAPPLPPTIKELRAIARRSTQSQSSTTKTQFYAAITQRTEPSSTVVLQTQSLSTMTSSQSTTDQANFSQPTTNTDLVLFKKDTESQLTLHQKSTVDTLTLFQEELAKANANAIQFQEVLLQQQQINNSRFTSLENNMISTVKGIQEIKQLLQTNIAITSSSTTDNSQSKTPDNESQVSQD